MRGVFCASCRKTPSAVNPASEAVDYVILFETAEIEPVSPNEPNVSPLEDLNVLIAEMVSAAQGEDQVRIWARRLSHILGMLRDAEAEREKENGKKKSASAVQDRLL